MCFWVYEFSNLCGSESHIGNGEQNEYRDAPLKRPKLFWKKLARYRVYTYIYNRVITFGLDQISENLRLLQEINV